MHEINHIGGPSANASQDFPHFPRKVQRFLDALPWFLSYFPVSAGTPETGRLNPRRLVLPSRAAAWRYLLFFCRWSESYATNQHPLKKRCFNFIAACTRKQRGNSQKVFFYLQTLYCLTYDQPAFGRSSDKLRGGRHVSGVAGKTSTWWKKPEKTSTIETEKFVRSAFRVLFSPSGLFGQMDASNESD